MPEAQREIPARRAPSRAPWKAASGMANATVVVVDSGGTVVSVNPDFEQTAGYSRYEILGKPVEELQDGDRDPMFFRLIEDAARCRRAGSPASHESATVHPMCDALGRVTGCVAIKHAVAPVAPV